ncbi:CmpA/NrtA family ABC transporter substrate-binding protein [Pannonibacter tanglangensis]|uniref:ABC transporter substrate-binding protein n=1 Tax=Pannonibacter tanglangensis TaxID=2750084 RepID=A0ABW9ZLI9_9HYPH|nr:CmpA/NrtA family ABC transporter substrate-binding protein [Pannonibacter sp. XCT-34]NBN65779.1 ABC transporter substrate-binding protein [Pannonibacter sp. XCT-34]
MNRSIRAVSGDPSAPAPGRRESRLLRVGFIPLVDASILIAASELGHAAREGLQLDLVRDVSWANVRDRLAFRQFDAAHMLAPMPVAAQLGLGSNPAPVVTPFTLGRGGNAITLSVRIFERMRQEADLADTADALSCAKAFARVVARRQAAGAPPLTLGVTYPFSSHNYEFRYWLAAGGVDPDNDVRLIVVPPPMTTDALAAGAIDGFCVGAPWNMIACERGVGRIVAAKQDIWPFAPEKVIGLRPDYIKANEDTVLRLVQALDRAARWCADPAHHDDLARILALPQHLAAPVDILRRVLAGEFCLDAKGTLRRIEGYFRFHGEGANRPGAPQVLWIYSQMIRWGQVTHSAAGEALAVSACRSDLYDAALGQHAERELDPALIASTRFMDGLVFDPSDVMAHVAAAGIPRQVRTVTALPSE